jgi:tetratricopeptide (TPR) repeat protein
VERDQQPLPSARLGAAVRGRKVERKRTRGWSETFRNALQGVLAAANKLYLEGGESLLRGLALFDLEWTNIQAGHDSVASQANAADVDALQLGMTYPDAGAYVLDLRQHSREQIRWLEIVLAAARRLQHRAGEGVALSNLGNAYANLDESRRAIQFFEQALLIHREIGYRKGEGNTLGNLGTVYADLAETNRAIQFFEQALVIEREIGDRRAKAIRGAT